MQTYFSIIQLTEGSGDAMMNKIMSESLNWEASYAIALALKKEHPLAVMEDVSLNQLNQWVLALPGFEDDPALANDQILMAIFQDWFEENL